jgi:Alkylmercury lyase
VTTTGGGAGRPEQEAVPRADLNGAGLGARDRAVRLAVYRAFADQGRPPSVAELAGETGLAEGDVRSSLKDLHDAHAIVLTAAGDAVRMAHPFSAAPMGFVVSADGEAATGYAGDRMWWGGCAWDSFGIGAALRETVVIRTRCPGCGTALTIRAGRDRPPEQDLVVHVRWPASRWWDDVVAACTNIRLFCSAAHVEAWARAGHPVGAVITSAAMWRLAQPWYGNRLEPGWSPRPVADAQQILEQCGLSGEFWQL